MKCRWPAPGVNQEEGGCIRCARMKIPCHVPAPVPRKKRGKSTYAVRLHWPAGMRLPDISASADGYMFENRRVAQLEQKIDSLVSMLASAQHIQPSGTPPLTPESHDADIAARGVPKEPASRPLQEAISTIPEPKRAVRKVPDIPLAVPSNPETTFQLIPGLSFTLEEVLSYFDIYRREYMPNYPFVIIPENLDPRALYASSRCLFWTILAAVAPQSSATQQGVETWFRQYIADQMVVKQERNLGILQALLLHLAWGNFHFYLNTESTNLAHLAVAMAVDLKLDRAPEVTRTLPGLLGEAWATINKNALRQRPHTADEKRAVLGLYHVTSLISSLSKRGHHFPWNNYLAQCCESLAESPLESDLFLVALVKMQRVVDRANCMLPGFDVVDSTLSTYMSPMDMIINNLRRELHDLISIQPECVKKKNLFKAYYHVTLMRFAEPAIPIPSAADMATLNPEPLQRFDTLWKCLLSAIDVFDTLLSFRPNQLPRLPTSVTGLLAFAIVTTSRLLLLGPSIDWQPAMARKKLDFADVAKRLGDRFEDADTWAKEAGRRRRLLEAGGAQFCRFSFKLRWIRQWYLSRVPQEEQQQQPAAAAAAVEAQLPGGAGEALQDLDGVFWDEYELGDALWPDFMTLYHPSYTTATVAET
ncbi:Zn2Cys6 transcriptional regulator [Trichoderma parareesei]|uniref:Zn2Cys6 transcriptional regulator n=1 Tax=Trichoderma parareesei TaxID=858221 RepID=A0A2H2ZLA7_TRIPA|nr:Zn2Cys6 transcriptional regulator [Trichoderma parareesei]